MEPELIDEIDCGNFFGQMEDLIEFPPDIECDDANVVSSSDYKDFPTWDEALQGCDSLFSVTSASDLAAELSVPVSFFYICLLCSKTFMVHDVY